MRIAIFVIALLLAASPAIGLPFMPMIISSLQKREAPNGPVQDAVPASSIVLDADPRAESGGGYLPSMPSLGGGGGDSPGMMFNQPMALMGGFTMLAMPAQDAVAMANSFQQFMSSMPSMPSMPQMPGLPG